MKNIVVILSLFLSLNTFAEEKKDTVYIAELDQQIAQTAEKINRLCWDNDRFIRGFTEAGERIGAAADPEANMWLNPQSWSVISGLATKEQASAALDNVYERLNTAYGAILMDPPYHEHAFDGALAVIYNQGTKENAGIFSQSQGWLILAEALYGHGERAFTYFMENAGLALSREKILNSVWNYDYFGDARTIDTHVKKLRSKMGTYGDCIKTIWGMGYKFEVDETA